MEISLVTLSYIAWLFFGVSVVLTVFIGAILVFHWTRYALSVGVTLSASVLYMAVSGALLLGMAATLIAFSLQLHNPLL